MNNITFLLNSCDKYSDTWTPFFSLLKRNWAGFDMPIILNTEIKQYSFEGLKIATINTPDAKTWSERLLNVLESVSTDYVLVFLEDFFIEDKVDTQEFERCFEYIRQHSEVGCISFKNTPDGTEESEKLHGYSKLPPKAKWRINCQVGIWRTSFLKKLLKKHESAWEFEKWGSYRSRFYKEEIYSVIKGYKNVFDYDWGKPIYRSHWNMQAINRIEEKCGIAICTDNLPKIDDMASLPTPPKPKHNLKFYLHRVRSFL